MKTYIFNDTDYTGVEEYNIEGEDYKTLIETCCKYSAVLSLLIVDSKTNRIEDLQKFRIRKPENISFLYDHYYSDSTHQPAVKYYRVSDELKELLFQIADSIFDWVDRGRRNPNDPTFYREDGSVFFTSIIHDGECFLTPKDDEDVEKIISNPLWKLQSDGGR